MDATVTLYVDINCAPSGYQDMITALGITFERWEPQPIADQVKLHGCTGVPDELPEWLKLGRLPTQL